MEIGIYITANIIYLVRELYLGDRIGSFSETTWRCKDWHGLHESSNCYFKVYAGTRNLQ